MNKNSKYIINYTLNEKASKTLDEDIKIKSFYSNSLKDIKSFLKDNKANMYWHEVVERHPKSKLGKITISSDDEGLSRYKKIQGVLQTHFETGMEGVGLILYRDDEPLGNLNPNFDPSKPESQSNFKHFQSHSGIEYIREHDLLEVGGVIYFLAPDHDFGRSDGWRMSLYPVGFSRDELLTMFSSGTKATLYKKVVIVEADKKDQEHLGKRIAEARKSAQLTQEQLSARLKIGQSQLSKFETGISAAPQEILKRISEETNKPYDWFFE